MLRLSVCEFTLGDAVSYMRLNYHAGCRRLGFLTDLSIHLWVRCPPLACRDHLQALSSLNCLREQVSVCARACVSVCFVRARPHRLPEGDLAAVGLLERERVRPEEWGDYPHTVDWSLKRRCSVLLGSTSLRRT